jgi:hypothetical protein
MILDKADYHDAGVENEEGNCDSNTHMICFLIWAFQNSKMKASDLYSELSIKEKTVQSLNENGWFDQIDSEDLVFEVKKAEKIYKAYLEEYGKSITKAKRVFYVKYDGEVQKLADETLDRLAKKYM